MTAFNTAYLSLGGNIGDKIGFLDKAMELISNSNHTRILKKSGFYQTQPWGFEDENHFINSVISIETSCSPKELLSFLQNIEHQLGRKEKQNKGYHAREIDIDILFYENEIINTDDLIIPHPHISNRRFVLAPLQEVTPHFFHPLLHVTVEQLYTQCTDTCQVIKINEEQIH